MRVVVYDHTGTSPEHQETYEGTPDQVEIYLRRAHPFLNREIIHGDLEGCLEAIDEQQMHSVAIESGEDELAKYEPFLIKHLREQGEALEKMASRDLSLHPGFQQWFQGSQAVGNDGRPLVAYHGTTKDFDQFQTQRDATEKQRNKRTWAGELGSWFSAPSKHTGNYDEGNAEYIASSFTEDRRRDAPYDAYENGARVIPVHLAIRKPAEFEGYEHLMDEAQAFPSWKHFRAHLESQGHDGAVVRNSMTDGNVDRDDWVAFHPHQIKSVNAQDFDLASPHFGKSEEDHTIQTDAEVNLAEEMQGLLAMQDSYFGTAHWMAGGGPEQLVSLLYYRECLLKHDGDVELAALAAYGIAFTDENLRALRGLVGSGSLTKAEEQPVAPPESLVPAHPDASETAEEVRRAFEAGTFHLANLNGKHSGGTMIGRDPQTKRLYLLKPGSGGNSPAKGVEEEQASQSRREAAFWHTAEFMGLGEYAPRADLLYINGQEIAAIRMLPLTFKNLGTALKQNPTMMPRCMMPYLVSGILHKWAILDYVLGNPDRHSQNIMIDEDGRTLRLIDHGSALAGQSFDPAHDQNSFIPYYLRAWTGLKFAQMDPAQRLRQMPTAGINGEKVVARWLRDIDPQRLAAKLQSYGIDPGPMVERLEYLKMLPGPKDQGVNKLWLGIGVENPRS